VGTKGAIVVWTEPAAGLERAFAVPLDDALRARAEPLPVTPEGESVQRPMIYPMEDRFLLVHWDTRVPGVYARYLDADGRIVSGQKTIAQALGGPSSPTVTMLPDKNLLFAWVQPSDKNTEDIYAQKFTRELEPIGEKIRLTAFTPKPVGRTRARHLTLGADSESIRLTFKLERDADRPVVTLRVPFASLTEPGVTSEGMNPRTPDRVVGKLSVLSKPKMRVETPTMACASDHCFTAWHEEAKDGVWASLLKGDEALFAREFVENLGKSPGINVNSSGKMQLFWYERARGLVTGTLDRDRIAESSTVARFTPLASAERTAPAVSAGLKENEWYATWIDFEASVAEVYAVRVECK